MLLNLFNVVYVLIAIAMIALILLQRGSGAQAGSGFGGGASNTVFGARGAANFLTRSTAVLATVFFLLSLGMGIYLGGSNGKPADDLGIMGGVEVPAAPKTLAPVTGDVPAVEVGDKPADGAVTPAAVPAAPNAAQEKPIVPAADANKPSASTAPAANPVPTAATEKPAVPAPDAADAKKAAKKNEKPSKK